jgi:hypothetical protein
MTKKRIIIPPKNLCKNSLSGLLIPIMIEIIPNPALKVAIIPANMKDLRCSFEETPVKKRMAANRIVSMRKTIVKKKSFLRDVIYQVSSQT